MEGPIIIKTLLLWELLGQWKRAFSYPVQLEIQTLAPTVYQTSHHGSLPSVSESWITTSLPSLVSATARIIPTCPFTEATHHQERYFYFVYAGNTSNAPYGNLCMATFGPCVFFFFFSSSLVLKWFPNFQFSNNFPNSNFQIILILQIFILRIFRFQKSFHF